MEEQLTSTLRHVRLIRGCGVGKEKLTAMSKMSGYDDKRVNSEGRAMILKEHKYIRSTYIIQAVLPNGSISYFINDAQCAKYFQVSNSTISRRLNDGKHILKNNEISVLMLKRIRAYSPHSYPST